MFVLSRDGAPPNKADSKLRMIEPGEELTAVRRQDDSSLCVEVAGVGISGAGSFLTSDVRRCFFVCLFFFLEVASLGSIA